MNNQRAAAILEVVDRAQKGERTTEQHFDQLLFRLAEQLKEQTGLRYDPDQPVALDDRAVDELFRAGLQLFVELGVYCTDTGRKIRFSEQEIRQAILKAPRALSLGEAQDAVVIRPRTIGGGEPPIVAGGIQTIPYSDRDSMLKVSAACARDRSIDGIWGGVLKQIKGHQILAKTPNEIVSYRETAAILREALRQAGRPGMFIIQNAPTSPATIGLYGGADGLRPTDPLQPTAIAEMKICFDDLNRSAYAASAGIPQIGAQFAILGGFSGSIEGAAIVCVASALQGLMVHGAEMVFPGVIHYRTKSEAGRDLLWSVSMALQAVNRNTNLILCADGGAHPAAGPGTRQYFYEAAAGFIMATASGAHPIGGTRKYTVGEKPNYGSPLESRWMGEVSKGSSRLSRERANQIVQALLAKYEANLSDAPEGHVFEELYDQDTMTPKASYRETYESVKEELTGLGIDFGLATPAA